jgi:hypothetical protein
MTYGTSWFWDVFYGKREASGVLLGRILPEFLRADILKLLSL